jgi:hypothetical protein
MYVIYQVHFHHSDVKAFPADRSLSNYHIFDKALMICCLMGCNNYSGFGIVYVQFKFHRALSLQFAASSNSNTKSFTATNSNVP